MKKSPAFPERFRALIALALILVGTSLAVSQTGPRKFYSYDVVATSNSNLTIFEGPSINDFGDVAFSGLKPNEPAVFLSRIGQPTIQFFTGGGSSFDRVGRQVHLNDSGQVLANFFNTNGGTRHYLRRITGVQTSTLIASSDPNFNDFSSITDNSFAMNGDGESVFIAQTGTGTPTLSLLQNAKLESRSL